MIGLADEKTPSMLNYKTYADNDSMFNTPPTYAIYICGLVLEWLETQIGGLENMEKSIIKKLNYCMTILMLQNCIQIL